MSKRRFKAWMDSIKEAETTEHKLLMIFFGWFFALTAHFPDEEKDEDEGDNEKTR